jgi:hypothetical protein
MGKARNLANLIADGVIGTSEIADDAVTNAKIAGMDAAKLSGDVATARLGSGTASSTTFLRGDRTWQTVSTTPTTEQVLTAYAGAAYGAVGTYTVALTPNLETLVTAGTTVAGSGLRQIIASAGNNTTGSSVATDTSDTVTIGLSGTWRLMMLLRRFAGSSAAHLNGIWLRIS